MHEMNGLFIYLIIIDLNSLNRVLINNNLLLSLNLSPDHS